MEQHTQQAQEIQNITVRFADALLPALEQLVQHMTGAGRPVPANLKILIEVLRSGDRNTKAMALTGALFSVAQTETAAKAQPYLDRIQRSADEHGVDSEPYKAVVAAVLSELEPEKFSGTFNEHGLAALKWAKQWGSEHIEEAGKYARYVKYLWACLAQK